MSGMEEIREKVEREKREKQAEYRKEAEDAGVPVEEIKEPNPPAWAAQIVKNGALKDILVGCTIKEVHTDPVDGSIRHLSVETEANTPLQLIFENDIEQDDKGCAKYSRVIAWVNDPAAMPEIPKDPNAQKPQ